MLATTQDLIRETRHAYFIGIGGVGMSALARVFKYQGIKVSGSDLKETPAIRQLKKDGMNIYLGQDRIEFKDADLVVYSSAIDSAHLELITARKMGLKVLHRAEVLSSLLNHAETSIAITGTHGKTTTSSMISFALYELGRNPTCLVGGEISNLGSNTILGGSDLWVSEVDESDKTHELYEPGYAVLTNLEEDHMDLYRDLEEIESSFAKFLSQIKNPGVIVYYDEDMRLRRLVESSGKPKISYGFSPRADFFAENVQLDRFGSEFDLFEAGFYSTRVRLSVPGIHNVANALAAMALLIQLGMDPEALRDPLARFCGARRRLEIKWKSDDVIVIDDYAHHPTEVRASLRALRGMGDRVTVIFQPHRFSRTRHFVREFGQAFDEADEIILTDIYAAGECDPGNVGVDLIYQEIARTGHPAVQVLAKHKITDYLMNREHPQGIVAFLGAGDIGETANEFADRYKSLNPA